jgi:ankyrin repeat protein
MKYIQYSALILLCITSIAYGMDTTYPTTANSSDALYVHVPNEKQQLVSTFLPKIAWQKIIALSSCKNMLRLVNQYLSGLASWSNREALIEQDSLYLTLQDAEKIAFELVEKDDVQKTKRVLQYLKKRFAIKEVGLSFCGASIMHYAKSNGMQKLLSRAHQFQAMSTKQYHAPLIQAARIGDEKELEKQLLILHDQDRLYQQGSQQSIQLGQDIYDAFMHAVVHGHSSCVNTLLKYMAYDDEKADALWKANHAGNVACVELLLKKDLVDIYGRSKSTLLTIAARYGRTYLVQLLLQNGADQLLKNDIGFRALDYALCNQHAEIIELLKQDLIAKNRPEVYDAALQNAHWYRACIEGDVKSIEHAVAQEKQLATISLRGKQTLLHVAAEHGHRALIEPLIKAGIALDCQDDFGYRPLIHAVANGHLEVVKILHAMGARLQSVDKAELSPLEIAVRSNQLPIAQYLVAHGAKVADEIDAHGNTLLHRAVKRKNVTAAMIGWLVEQGVLIDQLNNGPVPSTAFFQACADGHVVAVRELIKRGANQVLGEAPPFNIACWKGNAAVVQFLIEHGADINQETENCGKGFKTPLHSAIFGKQDKVVNILLAAGAQVTDDMIALAAREKNCEIEQLLHHKMHMAASMPSHLCLPNEVWEKIIALSSCKNMLRRANKYLYTFASWANRESLVNYTPLYVSETNLIPMIVEQFEKNNGYVAASLLKYVSTILKKDPATIAYGSNKTIWHCAKTDAMQNLLRVYGKKPAKFLDATHPLVEAAYAGNATTLNQLLLSIKPALESAEGSPDKQYAQELINDAACHAAGRGHRSCLALLIPYIAPVERPLVLFNAVNHCQIACVELLLEEKFPINVTQQGCAPALIIAATNGNPYLVELLLKHGADPLIQNERGKRALGFALANKHTEIVNLLTKHMKDLSQDTAILANTVFHALEREDTAVIEQALKDNPAIHTLEVGGKTRLLHAAAAKDNTAIMELLINAGADVNCVDGNGLTPLLCAMLFGKLPAVQMLHQKGADLNYVVQNNLSLLNFAVKHLPILHYFVDHGVEVKQLNADGANMLHAVIAIGLTPGPTSSIPDTIDYLVQQGVAVNHQAAGIDNRTPLAFACQSGNLAAAKQLVARGADIELGSTIGSPLIHACGCGAVEIVRYLIEIKAQFDTPLPNPVFKSPIYYAVEGDHFEVVSLLLEHGVRITDDLIAFAHARKKYDMEQFLKAKRDGV